MRKYHYTYLVSVYSTVKDDRVFFFQKGKLTLYPNTNLPYKVHKNFRTASKLESFIKGLVQLGLKNFKVKVTEIRANGERYHRKTI